MFEDATRWLRGSDGYTKLVIVIDIKEKMLKYNKTETTDWGLSKDVLNTLNSTGFTKHILQWHKENGVSLVGSFQVIFYLCFQNQEPRQVWRCEFSLDELEPKCFTFEGMDCITTQQLIPELDESTCFPLPLRELSTRMKKCLIDHQVRRASDKARKKWKEMNRKDT